ncbi:MAG TPA: alpha/beta hydrolase [Bryobacteraceae bacterium]|nr:alpha/beta hydrolase [Bryobacteraceae bacterium]
MSKTSMLKISALKISTCALFSLLATPPGFAQLSPTAEAAVHAENQYQAIPNVTYATAGGVDLKLDVYQRRGATTPQPTVIYIHGGFWAAGNKEGAILKLLPWMEMGWNVVNVEYRLAKVALAPAAVEDCMCALRFINNNAKMYNVDTSRIVVTGESAGGHLALSLGMIPESVGLARECEGPPLPKVAAVINWFGVTDVMDVIDGPHKANIAATWLGSLPNREELAKRLSPLTYVRPGLPPILTIQGDADITVPYDQGVRLHAALTKAGVVNQHLTIPGGKHGNFTPEERTRIYVTIREFLVKNGLGPK